VGTHLRENLGFMGFQQTDQQVVAMCWFGSVEEWKWDFLVFVSSIGGENSVEGEIVGF
jgi:hypothetical protein